MRSLIKDKSGIAFGIATVILFIVVAGAVYLIIVMSFNFLYGTANTMIQNNEVSQRAIDALSFNKKIVSAIPLFAVMGVLLWGWIRALEMRTTEG